jgi:nitrogen-specific signal transduction histidine kinase/ActR/RegA family two-component response regulator
MPRKAEPVASLGTDAAPERDPRSSPRSSTKERLASLGRLAAGVAHEINNPLAYVLGSVELVERALAELRALHGAAPHSEQLLDDAQAALENARNGVERIRHTVKDLTAFSRAAPDSLRPVDVEAVLDTSLKLAWNDLRHRARVVKELTLAPRVIADQGRLTQVFLNLLLNAAHSIPDGRQGMIRVSTRSEGGNVVVTIEDDGTGISAEDLPYVFDPFFAPSGASAGAGLGLAICKNVVTALEGTITVTSQPDVGSRFTVTLQAAGASSVSAVGNRAGSRERVTNRARILIIDDEPLLGQTLRFAFQDRHDVEVAASGREGLERLTRDSEFDLVLCDLMMPDVSGEHVYRAVRERSPALVPRFVFMTGGAFTERAQEFLAHFDGRQLEKPFNIDEVESLLTEIAAAGVA